MLFLTNLPAANSAILWLGERKKARVFIRQTAWQPLSHRRYLPAGHRMDTKHITATELTGFRQDLHQSGSLCNVGSSSQKNHTRRLRFHPLPADHEWQWTATWRSPVQGGMGIGIRRDKQPAVFLISRTPRIQSRMVKDSPLCSIPAGNGWLSRSWSAQHGWIWPFLNFLFHQVGRR